MAQRGDIQINNFVRGLVTEASPLTFPPGASLDEVNFVLKRDGTRERRLGLDLEDNYGLHDLGLSSAVLEGARCQAYRWSIPNGDIEQDIGVIQTGNRIWFIDLYTQNPSANILNGGNPVSVTEVDNSVIMTFTTINNYLVGVANQLSQAYLFNYDAATDAVTIESAHIAVRDLWGVDDSLDVNGRPSSLSVAHHYNLLNQGWGPEIQSTCGVSIDAIDCTYNTFGIYPSNSDQWSLGRVEDLTSADVKKFDPNIAARNLVSTGQAPRGHFIIDLYSRGESRNDQTGLTLPVDRETGRITAIAAYSGRIFYGGILSKVVGGDNRSPNLSGTVLFSQLFENKINLVKCYQEADPTSPDINDIVDTDGGLIQIPECSYIFALKAIKESLFVFAVNGIWEIRGGDNGFTATSYMVNKISNVGVYAPKSIVEVEGTIYFWAATGIHAIGRNENGVFQTTNLTLPTIQTLYNAIPDASKKNARGYHDLSQNRARWLYYSPESKTFGEAIDIDSVPEPAALGLTVSTPLATIQAIGRHPEIAKINNDNLLVIYTKSTDSDQVLYYRVVTFDTDLVGSFSSEGTLVASTGVGLTGFAIQWLENNKIFLTFRKSADTFGAIINYSASTISAGTPVALNNVFVPVLTTSTLQIAFINSGRVVIACKNTDNSKPTCQVVDIDASDVITFGSVAKSTSTNAANATITMLSSTTGIMLWNSFSNMSAEAFTISGTTITFNGTSYAFPTVAHTTGHSSYGCAFASISALNSTQAVVYGVGSSALTGGSIVYHPSIFTITESSGVLTSTTITKNTEYTSSGALSNEYPSVIAGDFSRVYTLHSSVNALTNKMYFTSWSNATTTPAFSTDVELASWSGATTYTNEEIVDLGGGRYAGIVQTNITNENLKYFAVRV